MARIDQVLSGEKSWGQYAGDVAGHMGLGAAWSVLPMAACIIGLDFGFGLSMAVGQPCALAGGVVRERVQHLDSGKDHPLDRSLDVLHHALGPPVAFGLIHLLKWVADLVT